MKESLELPQTSRDTILNNLYSNTMQRFEQPDLRLNKLHFSNPIASFIEVMESVGGEVVLVEKGENISHVIERLYPDARRIASNLSNIDCVTYNPDDVDDPDELNHTDLCIAKGEFGIIENGAVWIKKSVKYKAVYFISEALVILLDRSRLHDTMHDAYQTAKFDDFDYGCFMSGPSKTADIEQALVMGAQASRALVVLLTNEETGI